MGRLCSRRHITVGGGTPVALQASRTLPPSRAELPSDTVTDNREFSATIFLWIARIAFESDFIHAT
ncbi:hypothetical protein MSG28_008033 [Choristoneura fumiferana]|uniref:Uncharacterized protein n=1 Tax=Choristoneura fumiferana TaxID=7141 RepID=A0ACC0J9P6_CHOFU|nr:hypothetical protein MSG28_008033 [Choristoneura fumiferana]